VSDCRKAIEKDIKIVESRIIELPKSSLDPPHIPPFGLIDLIALIALIALID